MLKKIIHTILGTEKKTTFAKENLVFLKDEILKLLKDDSLQVMVKGETRETWGNLINQVENDECREAIDTIKEIKGSKLIVRKNLYKNAIIDVLNTVEPHIMEYTRITETITEYTESLHMFISYRKIFNRLISRKGFHIVDYSPKAEDLFKYLMQGISTADRLIFQDKNNDIYIKWKPLNLYLKKYFYQHFSLPSQLEYDSQEITELIKKAQEVFPMGKKIYNVEKYLVEKKNEFLRYYPRYLYSLFHDIVIEDIINNKVKISED